MSVEDIRQQLNAADALHREHVLPASQSVLMTAQELVEITAGSHHMPYAQPVVDAVNALVTAIKARVEQAISSANTIEPHAGEASSYYSQSVTGSDNYALRDAVRLSSVAIENTETIRDIARDIEQRTTRMATDIFDILAAAGDDLSFNAHSMRIAAGTAIAVSKDTLAASQAYAESLTAETP